LKWFCVVELCLLSLGGRNGLKEVVFRAMKSKLPMTGTAKLLAMVDPFIPDGFINEHWNIRPARGPRRHFSAAQLWRTHLLTVLTPAHRFNEALALLGEQRAWRAFAHLAHRERIPDVRMLHEFRTEVGVSGLRRINDQLRASLIGQASTREPAVALMDATDLEAACDGFKKKKPRLIPPAAPAWESAALKPARVSGM
jgi:hypothetical protein